MNRPEHFQFDIRVRSRLMDQGLLTQQELDAHLTALPNVEGRAESVSLPQPSLLSGGVEPTPPPVHVPVNPTPPPVVSALDAEPPSPSIASLESLPLVSPFESSPGLSTEPAPKVNPFEPEPVPSVSPFEASLGTSPRVEAATAPPPALAPPPAPAVAAIPEPVPEPEPVPATLNATSSNDEG